MASGWLPVGTVAMTRFVSVLITVTVLEPILATYARDVDGSTWILIPGPPEGRGMDATTRIVPPLGTFVSITDTRSPTTYRRLRAGSTPTAAVVPPGEAEEIYLFVVESMTDTIFSEVATYVRPCKGSVAIPRGLP
jgi:hypothetical protein